MHELELLPTDQFGDGKHFGALLNRWAECDPKNAA